jgi:hypothetical protein
MRRNERRRPQDGGSGRPLIVRVSIRRLAVDRNLPIRSAKFVGIVVKRVFYIQRALNHDGTHPGVIADRIRAMNKRAKKRRKQQQKKNPYENRRWFAPFEFWPDHSSTKCF